MFARFHQQYGVGEEVKALSLRECGQPEVQLVTSRLGGSTFGDGVYRVHLPADVGRFTDMAKGAFPSFATRITCFASDWLGRQFAIDAARNVSGRPEVLMLEPGTGEVLEIPGDIESFHDDVLVAEPDAALAISFYAMWRSSGGSKPSYEQCVGYQRPLYLGGYDEVENLQLADFEVYWGLSAQLLTKAAGLQVGRRIGKVSIGD
jgi:hypothetical protein